MAKFRRIEIDFPLDVEIDSDIQQAIDDALSEVCRRYKRNNPGRTMWVFGVGCKMLSNPFMVDDEHPLEFDEGVLHFEISERENYA